MLPAKCNNWHCHLVGLSSHKFLNFTSHNQRFIHIYFLLYELCSSKFLSSFDLFFFSFGGQTSDILYYEVLDIPLPELQGLKNLKVAFHHATKDEVCLNAMTNVVVGSFIALIVKFKFSFHS